MQEQWTRWEPAAGLAHKYYIDSIFDSLEGFKIVLSELDEEKKKIYVIFKNSVASHIRTDESFRLSTMHELGELHGRPFFGDWTFFKVSNSLYIKYLSDQSYGISDERSFIHFSFIAGDSFLDVIATDEPEIEFVHLP